MLLRRLLALYTGLWLYGFSMAVMIRAGLGLDPWDSFHQGVARHVPISFGTVTALTGIAVLLAWIPLRQKPGLGTVSNIVMIAVSVDSALWFLPHVQGLAVRVGAMVAAVLLNAVATVLYIGAGMGPGPRDGLMTGLVSRTGWPVWRVRTAIEASVLITGWLLGGSIGIGTLIYALGIGPLIHLLIPVADRWLPGFHTSAHPNPRLIPNHPGGANSDVAHGNSGRSRERRGEVEQLRGADGGAPERVDTGGEVQGRRAAQIDVVQARPVQCDTVQA
jgi:uncharacterized membrane protein YczE